MNTINTSPFTGPNDCLTQTDKHIRIEFIRKVGFIDHLYLKIY